MSLLEIDRLRVTLGEREIVRGVDMTIAEGEIAGLIGESGSGKSMTAAAILRLLPANGHASGRISLDGQNLLTLSEQEMTALRGATIGFVPQEPMTALNPTMRVGRQLELPLRRHRAVTGGDARSRAAAMLSRLQIADPERVLDSYPFELSGGMRQRILLANAFMLEPQLILADEPTTALDVTVQAEVLALLVALARETATAVLFITHNMGIVWRICDSVHVMQNGRIVETGAARDVLAAPQQPYTKSLCDALPERAAPRMPILGDA